MTRRRSQTGQSAFGESERMSSDHNNIVCHAAAYVFNDRRTARRVRRWLGKEMETMRYEIVAVAIVETDGRGRATYLESSRVLSLALLGGLGGALLGLVAGPAGMLVAALAGAVLGGLLGRGLGRPFSPYDLRDLAGKMEPNSSALLAIVQDTGNERWLHRQGVSDARIVTLTLGDEANGRIIQTSAHADPTPSPFGSLFSFGAHADMGRLPAPGGD